MADDKDMPPAEIHERADASARHLRHFVVAAAVAATAVVAVAVAQALAAPADLWVLGVAAGGMALATAVPLLVQHDAADDSAHGHVAVLVPVVYLLAWHGVVVVVATGVAFGWLLRRVLGARGAPPATCNADVVASLARGVLAAAAAGVVASWQVDGATTPVVLAVGGALTFLMVDRVLAVAMTPAAGRRRGNPRPVRRLLAITTAGLALGLLTTMVVAAYPAPGAWLGLQVVLGVGIALALASLDMGRAHHAALLRIAAHAHASMDVAAVERAVDDILTPLVRAARVEIRDLPPFQDDVGTPLPLPAGDPAWLVATHRGRVGGFSDRDRRLLASAAPLVATAVENARRHGDMTTRAATDPLTGVANRRTFEEQLSLRLRHSRITDATTALMVLDLDDFKAINDEIGHGPGDELLVDVARRLTGALRADDLVARLGGDEFAVVAGLGSAAEEDTLVQRIADGLAGLEARDGRPVSVSFGVAVAPRDGRTTRDVYDAADRRMYAVKHGEAA